MKKLSLVFFVAFVSIAFAGNAKDDWQWDYADCEFEKLDESKITYRRVTKKLSNGETYSYEVVANPKYDTDACGNPIFTIIKAKSMQEAHDKLKKAKKVLDWTCSEAEWAIDGTLIYVNLEKCSYKLEFLGTLPKQNYRYKGKCYDKDFQYKCESEEWYAQYEWSKDKKQLTITYAQSCGDDSYILFDLGNGTFKIVKTIERC